MTVFTKQFNIRRLTIEDIGDLCVLEKAAWNNMAASVEELERRIVSDPLSTYGAYYNGDLAGSVTYVRVDHKMINRRRWFEYTAIFGNPDAGADCLYIVSLSAHPSAPRGVGRELLRFSCQLSREIGLEYMAYGSRIPRYHEYSDHMSVESYIEKVKEGSIIDPVLSLSRLLLFEIVAPVKEYYCDEVSKNYGVIVCAEVKNI